MKLISAPKWATEPDLNISAVSVADYFAIQRHRTKMLEVVHREIEEYLNTPGMYFEGAEDGFPHRERLNGEYYIGSESYIAHIDPVWIQIGIMCRCLEHPKVGVKREDDYLGLGVWLKCVPEHWSTFEVFRNTDSSSI